MRKVSPRNAVLLGLVILNWAGVGRGNVVLFTTTSDFSGAYVASGGGTAAASTAADFDGSTVNGAGNPSADTSTAGSLKLTTATNGTVDLANEATNAAFLAAVDPGATAATISNAGSTTAASGQLSMTYTLPAGATTIAPAINFAYNSNYSDILSPVNTSYVGNVGGLNWYASTFNYSIAAGPLTTFNVSIGYDPNTTAGTPFYIDDIQTVPEPATLGISAVAALLLLRRRPSH